MTAVAVMAAAAMGVVDSEAGGTEVVEMVEVDLVVVARVEEGKVAVGSVVGLGKSGGWLGVD